MELRHLRYFIAVAEESSLRRAAHRLHVSQPALSQQISELEDELGLKLFTRNSRGVQLTEAGRTFLLGGRRTLAAAKLAAEQAQEAAKGQRGRLVIGHHGPLTIAFLPGILSRFREQHPLVEITLLHLNNRAQVEAVLNGSIMLGIGYYSWALEEDEEEQVSARLLLRSPVGIICPKNRRLPKRPIPKLEDFRHDKFLSLDPAYSVGYEEWLRGFCKGLGGFEPDITASANSPETLIGLVASGRGIFVGSELTIRGREEIWRSVGDYYPLAEPESYFELFAIWKKQSQLEPAISEFIDLLVTELKSP
jgi:DNA-binding transcriptional LysR family regulator